MDGEDKNNGDPALLDASHVNYIVADPVVICGNLPAENPVTNSDSNISAATTTMLMSRMTRRAHRKMRKKATRSQKRRAFAVERSKIPLLEGFPTWISSYSNLKVQAP
jgi:hypothetical protein